MTVDPPELPDELRQGRLALEGHASFALVDDWQWHGQERRWHLRCQLRGSSGAHEFIPEETDWYVVTDVYYPWGSLDVFPAKEGGITATFPHQSCNTYGPPSLPWRMGKICCQTTLRQAGRRGLDVEPTTARDRLRWTIDRAVEWLDAAASGTLWTDTDPFELPDFPGTGTAAIVVAFREDAESHKVWADTSAAFGVATIASSVSNEKLCFLQEHLDTAGHSVHKATLGPQLADEDGTRTLQAVWVRTPRVPVLRPWQAPTTFGELRTALSDQGVELDNVLGHLLGACRDGARHLLLIGFGIPETFSGELVQHRWQALLLPRVAPTNLKGHRNSESSRIAYDRRVTLADSRSIDWVKSENWSPEETHTRGRLAQSLRDRRVAVVGCGALGSMLAELLIRGGLPHLLLADGENVDCGNLCRHTLTMGDVGHNKAQRLAQRLRLCNACAEVVPMPLHLSDLAPEQIGELLRHDVIIDCTGADQASRQLSSLTWDEETAFANISVGFGAGRLYYFVQHGHSFPFEDFWMAISPWMDVELKACALGQLKWEGIGCWHPVFPARVDDMWLMAASAVRMLDQDLMEGTASQFRVVEQVQEKSRFGGLVVKQA